MNTVLFIRIFKRMLLLFLVFLRKHNNKINKPMARLLYGEIWSKFNIFSTLGK